MHSEILIIPTSGRGTYEITSEANRVARDSNIDAGVCSVFIHHTSASLILCENADPVVRDDLERFAEDFAPDGAPMFQHTDEGPDDMPAHVRSVFTSPSITIPVANGRCDLGTWQGLFVWEHRISPHKRRVTISVLR